MDAMNLLLGGGQAPAPYGNIVLGVVEDNADTEKKGILKVRIPMLEADHDLVEDVRVMCPYGGGGGGFYFLPEVGALVLVALLGGPYGRAYLLGSIYPKDDAFIDSCFDEKNQKKVVSSSTGVTLTLSDEKDKQSLTAATPKGVSILLEDEKETIQLKGSDGKSSIKIDIKNKKIEITAGEELHLECGKASITLKKDGAISLEGKGDITVKAQGKLKASGQSVKLSGQSSAELSGQQVTVKGQATVKVSGQSTAEVSSSGITKVKGSMLKLN